MNSKELTSLPASVIARLRNLARSQGRPADETDRYYAMECLLRRLSVSPYAGRFTLKGALLLQTSGGPRWRATKDIDLLGAMENSVEKVVQVVREVCVQEVAPDGMRFAPDTVRGQRITDRSEYPGVRVRLRGYLGEERLDLQVDVGFGDVLHPGARAVDYPSLLGGESLRLSGYPWESVVAEKLETMVSRGEVNSRYKDFYDVWLLAEEKGFAGATLAEAVRRTFETRNTDIPEEPLALTEGYAADRGRQTQWRAFLRTADLEGTPDFPAVVAELRAFLGPLVAALARGEAFEGQWLPGGPWTAG